jgi:hypothetical protein
MTDSGFDHDERVDQSLDASTAARLLADAERVGASLRARTDFRAGALIQGWTAAAIFVYVATFLLLFGNPAHSWSAAGIGHNYVNVNVLLIPFLVLSQLVQGARNRLPISVALPRRGVKLLLVLPGMTIFLAAATAALVGIEYPWWASLLVAAVIAAPLGGLAISTARKAGGTAPHSHGASPRPPLGRTAAGMTAGLGAYFGVVAALTPYSWFPVAALFLTLALLVQLIGWSARWGLPSVGSEWGQPQWVAFGITFTLLFALTILATKTAWNTPLVATISSIVIAAPLVCSTLRTYRQR